MSPHHNSTSGHKHSSEFVWQGCDVKRDCRGQLLTSNCLVLSWQRQDALRHPQMTGVAMIQCQADGHTLERSTMDVIFLAHSGRKRKIAKQDKENIEKRVREVAETSIQQVQHWFLVETDNTVPGDHAKVHEGVREAVHKDESAPLGGCAQGQTLELVSGYEAPDRSGASSNSNMLEVDAQVFNEMNAHDSQQLRLL